nr:hypothetical protein [Tanacetum cinerariifolium]
MSTQKDIYAAGSESRLPMLNKENYVPWSSRLLRYAKSRPNGKLIHNSILNGPYVKKMIPEPGDANRDITVTKTFHLQTDDELSDKELKQIEADDQAIQTILLGLPEDIYAAVDREEGQVVQRMRKPEWSRHVTIVHQTKDLDTADYTQLYDFLKYNQKEADCSTGYKYGSRQINADGWSAPVYDTDGSAEVYENCDENEIFNMFTQEEQYTELLKPILESHQVPHNDNDVISEDTSVEQGGEIVEQHPANFEETRVLYESLYQNLAIEVEKFNSVNRKLKETNVDLTTELARFKN